MENNERKEMLLCDLTRIKTHTEKFKQHLNELKLKGCYTEKNTSEIFDVDNLTLKQLLSYDKLLVVLESKLVNLKNLKILISTELALIEHKNTKTLVIHPRDSTTDFLKPIYEKQNWTVLIEVERLSKSKLKKLISAHDRIVMLGHGTGYGLLNPSNMTPIIDSNLVYLLREKNCVCIWCNANEFVEKYGIKGFYTGMIISDYMEANMYSVNATYQEIEKSNELFAESIKLAIEWNNEKMLGLAKTNYTLILRDELNRVIDFNKHNLFYTSEPITTRKNTKKLCRK